MKPSRPDNVVEFIASALRNGDLLEFKCDTEGPLNRDLVVSIRIRHNPEKTWIEQDRATRKTA